MPVLLAPGGVDMPRPQPAPPARPQPALSRRPQPVFVDRTGRRRRLTVLVGAGAGTGLLVSLALIVAGLFTGSPAAVPAWPDTDGGRNATTRPQVVRQKAPTAPATPTAPAPGRTTSAGAAASTSPGATGPGTVATDQPGQSDEHRARPASRPSRSPGKPT